MKIERIRTIAGPNVFHHRPVLVMEIDLEELAGRESTEVVGFNERLLALVPGLAEHHCAKGAPGGFLERLSEGTYFGHVVEHVALELGARAGATGNFGKSVRAGRRGIYQVVVEYQTEAAARYLLEAAVGIVEQLVAGRDPGDVDAIVERAIEIRERTALDPGLREVVEAAERREIPWRRVEGEAAVELGYGRHFRIVRAMPEAGRAAPDGDASAPRAGDSIVAALYGAGESARIPIVSITGTNGKTTVTRLVAHVLSETGVIVGMTTTEGSYVEGTLVLDGDTTGPYSARTVLSNPAVDVAVLETARGGIVRRGLGYDWSDVGVLTNVRGDHIGQDGIESVDDILHIKSLVAERVREGGTLVLNAEDEALVELSKERRIRRIERRIVFFALSAEAPALAAHREEGGTGYWLDEEGWLVEGRGEAVRRFVQAVDVPITYRGASEFQIANALASAAICRALGLDLARTALGLQSFSPERHNPGRTNLYRVGDAYALVDYGHNADAFRSIGSLLSNWPVGRRIGVVGVPGDRADRVIDEAGAEAALWFDRILIREDADTRGRPSGEIPKLLKRAIRRERPDLDVRIVLDEVEAVRAGLEIAESGDVVAVFAEDPARVLESLREQGAEPAAGLPEPVEPPET